MNRQINLIAKLFFLLSIVLIQGCDTSWLHKKEFNLLILVDFSQSVKDEQSEFKNSLMTAINTVPSNSRVIVGKIGENTESTFLPIADVKFPEENELTGNKIVDKELKDKATKTLLATHDSLLLVTEHLTLHTDIISSLNLAKSLFEKKSNCSILFLSDMIEDSDNLNLETANISDEFIDKTISKLRADGRIPDLKGFKIFVAGARAKNDQRYREIQKFWTAVFKESGASLESYGHSLIDFEIK